MLLRVALLGLVAAGLAVGCTAHGPPCDGCPVPGDPGGKADGTAERAVEVILTDPFCDVCTDAEKTVLLGRSRIIARVVDLIDHAAETIDVAQYTFSRTEIEQALVRAHGRGVRIRIALDAAQDVDGTVGRRLLSAGLDVRFVAGRPSGSRPGLMHAKFMRVDGTTLLSGSNNWSSTGTSINEESTIVVRSTADDPLLAGFACHFEAIWAREPAAAGACSGEGMAFAPSAAPRHLLRDGIRGATRSIDVLMHHFTFTDLVDELADAAERGVRVRVVVNAADRAEHRGRHWDRIAAAGGEVRYKSSNTAASQLMHHKLAIVDGRVLLNGSGNWSGGGFFSNFENYVRWEDPRVVGPFRESFERIWSWSLRAGSIDLGLTAAEQDAADHDVFFGNLHAHIEASADGRLLDDGRAVVLDAAGAETPASKGATPAEAARLAFEYGRDRGRLDFLALTPHTSDHRDTDPRDYPNMTPDGYAALRETARAVTDESGGGYLALAGFEWSTNSTGNHVNVLGATELCGVERGRFDLFFETWLRERTEAGDAPVVMMNHPRTFRMHEETLEGNWDQLFGVALTDIPRNGDRNVKFNDFGLDDFLPLRDVRQEWIAGTALPDEAVVAETLGRIREASAPYARLMEVTVGRGNDLGGETPSNPSITVAEDGTASRFDRVHRDFDYYLGHGFRLAPAASHDNHFANWGTGHTTRTAVALLELDEEALLDALRRRRVYATEAPELVLRFYLEDRIPMGAEAQTIAPSVRASVFLEDPEHDEPFEVRIWRGAPGAAFAPVQTLQAGSGWSSLELDVAPGEQVFYVEVLEAGPGRMAWSSPIWLTRL
jgi:phosphatidylserine/phosphatidylglycerophosphate/cardiolipin synthase-like enzyme